MYFFQPRHQITTYSCLVNLFRLFPKMFLFVILRTSNKLRLDKRANHGMGNLQCASHSLQYLTSSGRPLLIPPWTYICIFCSCSSGSSGRVRGGWETWNLCGRLRWPSFLWPIFTGQGGGMAPSASPGSATELKGGSTSEKCRMQKAFLNLIGWNRECPRTRNTGGFVKRAVMGVSFVWAISSCLHVAGYTT